MKAETMTSKRMLLALVLCATLVTLLAVALLAPADTANAPSPQASSTGRASSPENARAHGKKRSKAACAATNQSGRSENSANKPTTRCGSNTTEEHPHDPALETKKYVSVERGLLRTLTFRKDDDGYDEEREGAKKCFDYAAWPREQSRLKAGFKFSFSDFPMLAHFSAWNDITGLTEQWGGDTSSGTSHRNGVWWGIGDRKVGVQRWYRTDNDSEHIYASIFVGDTPKDAQIHLIDQVSANTSSMYGANHFYMFYMRDAVKVGDVSLAAAPRDNEYFQIKFVRANIYVSVELSPSRTAPASVNLAALASDIDAAILKLPDVTPEELEALRPVFTKCELARNPIIAGGAWDSKEGVTSATLKVTDPRCDRIFRADAVSQRGYLGGGTPLGSDPDVLSVVAGPNCPAGEHSLWFTAINEHLLFSVYECKVKVERKE